MTTVPADFNLSLEEKSSYSVALPSKVAFQLPVYIEFIGEYYTKKDFYTKRQDLNNYMLMYTLSGEASLEYDGNQYVLEKNSLFLIDCLRFHYFEPLSCDWHYRWIHISGEAIQTYYNLLYPNKPQVIYPNISFDIDQIFTELTSLVNSPSIKSDLKINNIITNLFTEVISQNIPTDSTKNSQYVKQCIDFIANNYQRNINIDELAQQLFVSKYHLIKLFNQSVGVSPYRYLTEYRINQSKYLLLNTDMFVGEIATRVGFNSESHYIKLFNTIVGTTPKQFRKNPQTAG